MSINNMQIHEAFLTPLFLIINKWIIKKKNVCI